MRKSGLSKRIQDKLIEHFVAGTTARCAGELIIQSYLRIRKITSKEVAVLIRKSVHWLR